MWYFSATNDTFIDTLTYIARTKASADLIPRGRENLRQQSTRVVCSSHVHRTQRTHARRVHRHPITQKKIVLTTTAVLLLLYCPHYGNVMLTGGGVGWGVSGPHQFAYMC